MPVCRKCSLPFPNRVKIDGVTHTLSKRSYCLECSPFGRHNTKNFGKATVGRCTKCNRADARFYGHKKSCCGACHNTYTIEKGREKRERIVAELGGKCLCCGYAAYICSLAVHHLDPSQKDPSWSCVRGWSWARIEKEIANCILLCSNCHMAYHAGLISLPEETGV